MAESTSGDRRVALVRVTGFSEKGSTPMNKMTVYRVEFRLRDDSKIYIERRYTRELTPGLL